MSQEKSKRKRGPSLVGWWHWMGQIIVENKPDFNLPARFSIYAATEWERRWGRGDVMIELFLVGLCIFLITVIPDLIIATVIGSDAQFFICLCPIIFFSFLYPWYLLYVGLYEFEDEEE